MHERNTTDIAHRTTTQDITWFTPSVGVTSTELSFIQLSTKTTVLICALSCRSLQTIKSAHTAIDFLNHPKPSAHTAAEVIHAHRWDLNFSYKISLASHQFLLHKKPNLTSLQEYIFIQRTYYKTMGLNHGHPEPQTLVLNHGFITKRGL